MDHSTTPVTKRRKRSHVPETSRKRVAIACQSCRRTKEKCHGGFPCSRCTRLDRECEVDNMTRSSKAPRENQSEQRHDFLNPERIELMEQILRKYAGNIEMSEDNLRKHLHNSASCDHNRLVAAVTPSEDDIVDSTIRTVPNKTTLPTKYDLSHCKFFDSVQSRVDERIGKTTELTARAASIADSTRTARLLSPGSAIIEAIATLPPIEVARFLVDMFFKFAETNYCYVNEVSIRRRLETVYSESEALAVFDAPSISTILMVLALGTQFAHLSSEVPGNNIINHRENNREDVPSPDDNVSLKFYHSAATLLPDVLVVPCIESVYALLLLGVYILPIDAAGLAYTYLGMAVRVAVQNGMHRGELLIANDVEAEMRNRTFWTAYILEKRIAVLHGMPTAIWRSDIEARMPQELPIELETVLVSNVRNFIATINMTCILEEAGSTICSLQTASHQDRSNAMATLSKIVTKLTSYWSSLPSTTWCRDLDPSIALFRSNAHLSLSFHLIRMFIGRNFIFDLKDESCEPLTPLSDDPDWEDVRNKLVSSCMESALATIDLCQLLKDEVGLARASYTEFTSCRTAVLVIIAKRIQGSTKQLHQASEKGLDLLRHMSVGLYSAAAEKAAIATMGLALRRLNRSSSMNTCTRESRMNSAYESFRNWANVLNKASNEQFRLPEHSVISPEDDLPGFSSSTSETLDGFLTLDFDPLISAFPFEFESST